MSASPKDPIIITAQDLPLHCPGSKAPLWSMHPRVFLDISHTGHVSCPYCGANYQLDPNTALHDHGH